MTENRELAETLCDLEIPGDIRIAPSGEHIVYTTTLTWGHQKGKYPVSTLWLAILDVPGSSRQISAGNHKDHSLAWHPLQDEFAFTSDRAGNGTKSAIYSMSMNDIPEAIHDSSGDTMSIDISPTQITPVQDEPIEKFRFSAEGKLIAYISKDKKSERERLREENGEDVQVWGEDERCSRLHIIDIDTKESRTLELDEHVMDICWSPEVPSEPGSPEIGFVTCKDTLIETPYLSGTSIYVVDRDLVTVRKVCHLPNRANDLTWGSTNYGESEELYFRSTKPMQKNYCGTALYKVSTDVTEGSPERVTIGNEHDDVDVMSVRAVDGHILTHVQRKLEDRIYWNGRLLLYSDEQELQAFDTAFGFDDGHARSVVATSCNNVPFEVYTVKEHDKDMCRHSQHGKSLKRERASSHINLSCLTSDGSATKLDGIFMTPTSNKPYPTIVLIHGGPWARMTNAFSPYYYMITPYLLSLGCAVLMPNYRGSSGYGEKFASFSYDGIGDHAYKDIIALTQHAIEEGLADPERLMVGGYSHGGFLTNLCAVRNGSHRHGWRFKAAISGSCISDVESMSLTSDLKNVYLAELVDGTPWTMYPEDTSARAASALWSFKEAIERSKDEGASVIPPFLILHGEKDERCHVSQARGLAKALEHYSLPFEMAIYPRQGHIFHEQKFWIDMLLRIGRFLEKHIGVGDIQLP